MRTIVVLLMVATACSIVYARQKKFEAVRWAIDLRKPPDDVVVRTTNARVYAEPNNPVCYWAPERQYQVAEVVYRFDVQFSIDEVRLTGVGVEAWNQHADVCFDPDAAAVLECSFDGQHWQEIASHTPARGVNRTPETLKPAQGSRSFWLRARLYETKSWDANRVHHAQFLRSHPAKNQMPVLEICGEQR